MDNLFINDPDVNNAIKMELLRQQNSIELIASENIVSKSVLEAAGSILTNKYAEGYPGQRYYGGCRFVDIVENLAIERLCKLFNCQFANVQPHSGSQANQAVFLSLMQPGDKFLGMSLASGGHLTHGAKPNLSGKWFSAIQYGLDPQTNLIDYDQIRKLAKDHNPKIIIAGGSAYPRIIDFKLFKEIAEEVGAYLMVDMAHIAGLVASEQHPSPFPYADIVTSTTHKTLRGPRGGVILTNNQEIAKKINSAIFPGLQGGPLMHIIAAKAVAFGEALKPEFQTYGAEIISNAKVLAKSLTDGGLDLVTNGTDNHLLLVDLRPKKVTGVIVEKALEEAGITCNKNSIPNDPEKPTVTSGIRLGTPATTTRGFKEKEFELIGKMILQVINSINEGSQQEMQQNILTEVKSLCQKFPIYHI